MNIKMNTIYSKINLGLMRTLLAPLWRKLIAIIVIIIGLTLFVGMEYGLGKLIIADNYLFAVGIFTTIAILYVTIAYPLWGYAFWFFMTRYLYLFGGVFAARYNFDFVMLGLILIVLSSRALIKREISIKFSSAEVLLILFFVYAYVIRKDLDTSVATAPLKYLLLSPLFFYFLAKNAISEKKHIYWFMIVIILAGVSFALMGIYEQITGKMWLSAMLGGNRGLYADIRSTGPAGHYYVYGNILILTILLCMYLLKWQKYWFSKLALVISGAIALVGLYYGYSRSPYIAFILSLISMLILTRYTRRIFVGFLSLIIIVGIITVPFMWSEKKFQERITSNTISSRKVSDHTSMNMFRTHMLFGVGRDRYLDYVSEYMAHGHLFESSKSGLVAYYARSHSEYFGILAELGITGFVLYFLMYIMFMIKFIQLRFKLPANDVFGSDFACLAIAFSVGVFVTMYTDEYIQQPYMYAIIFTLYAMVKKAEYYAIKECEIKST